VLRAPRFNFVDTGDSASAGASVFITAKLTPLNDSRARWLTALHPAPPTPSTVIAKDFLSIGFSEAPFTGVFITFIGIRQRILRKALLRPSTQPVGEDSTGGTDDRPKQPSISPASTAHQIWSA
jgi:hypothetical protein